jgi:SMI1 / KNR4 family (SUKH-1)
MGRGHKMRDLEWEYADSEVPESIIKQIGLQLGFNLPQDYIECVKINGGASVFPEEFSVGKVERCFGSLFSFDKESSEYIVKKYDIYSIFLPRAVLPIANDPA